MIKVIVEGIANVAGDLNCLIVESSDANLLVGTKINVDPFVAGEIDKSDVLIGKTLIIRDYIAYTIIARNVEIETQIQDPAA